MQIISRKTKQYICNHYTGKTQELVIMFFSGFICGAALAFNRFEETINPQALKAAKQAFGEKVVFNRAIQCFKTVQKLVNENQVESTLRVDFWIHQQSIKHDIRFEAFQMLMYGCRYGAIPMIKANNLGSMSDKEAIDITMKSLGLKHYCNALVLGASDLHEILNKKS